MRGTREGLVLWITGPPASGKTTLAAKVIERLHARGVVTVWLDSDDLRSVMTPTPSFSESERDVFYGTLAHLAARAAEGGAVAVVSATAGQRRWRDDARAKAPHFVEVWVRCEEGIRRRRDPKGLYAAADRGELDRLPGVHTPYEPPLSPELIIYTTVDTPQESADKVLDCIAGLIADVS